METLLPDLRHAIRMFPRGGGSFTLVAFVPLAFGIGANTAIFSLEYSACEGTAVRASE